MNRNDEATSRYLDLVERQRRVIYKVCYMYATSKDHLNDLYQEVLANIWQGLPKFRGESLESTWVYRIALNTCVSYFRRNDRHSGHLSMADIPDIADDSDSAEHLQQLKQMYRMIAELPALDKALIMMWLDEYSYDDIAEASGLTRANVASRLLRAKRKLMKRSNE